MTGRVGDPVGLDRLLDLEDDPAFVELRCPTTGVLAWPAIRQDSFGQFLGDRLYSTAPLVDLTRRPVVRRVLAGAVRATLHNRRHPMRRSDVLIVANGAGLILRDGGSFNRYTDYFADRLGERAWTVESLSFDVWPSPPRTNRRLTISADHRLRRLLSGQASVRPIHRKLASELVDLFRRRARDRLGWELGETRRAALVRAGARRLATYPIQARFVRGLVQGTRPRLVLVHEGCYGHLAVFNATVREFGIPVAEYQHGMITQGHDAYNVAPRLAASDEYRQTLPDEFLAYGSWWNEQFNAPVARKVVIGNPHRTETLRTWRPEQGRATVLVLGDGAETAARLDLSRRLAAMLPRPFSVVYRPHPREREVAERLSDGAVTIDASPDLYETLERAAALVGEPSTVLFEAVGLVPRIFVWDTAKTRFYLGDHPFERFVDPAEVAERLVAGARGEPQIDVADLWADDWQGRFRRYAAAKLG